MFPSGSRRYAKRWPQNASHGLRLPLEPGIDDARVGRVDLAGIRAAEGQHDPLAHRAWQVRLDLPDQLLGVPHQSHAAMYRRLHVLLARLRDVDADQAVEALTLIHN